MMPDTDRSLQALHSLLLSFGQVKVALSGGIDSLTLAIVAGRCLGENARMFHALSPAVPQAATERVKHMTRQENWRLELVDAGEMRDAHYLSNPYRRCYHCKRNLYSTLATGPGITLSGTNLDDLGDFRPGLQAAQEQAVRHPFVECTIGKQAIRRLCHSLGYPQLAELPASPCLASRVQTGLPIEAAVLTFIDRVEDMLREQLAPQVVRCRIRADQIAVQLDADSLLDLAQDSLQQFSQRIGEMALPLGLPRQVQFEDYAMGSAFVEPT
jgi:uncharacterized protein